jgi:hypothetical protein
MMGTGKREFAAFCLCAILAPGVWMLAVAILLSGPREETPAPPNPKSSLREAGTQSEIQTLK